MTTAYRLADESEDELAARILYNSFLYNWDINWWQNLRRHTYPVDASRPSVTASSSEESLTSIQQDRLAFYRAVIKLVRLIGGIISVAIPTHDPAESPGHPAAVLCWLPPGVQVTTYAVIRSGLFFAILRLGRWTGTLRFLSFESSLSRLYDRCLRPIGYASRHQGAFVQILGTDPKHAGKGLARGLLQWQVDQHQQQCLDEGTATPVFLDTAGDYQQMLYERLGFQLLGKQRVPANVDAQGLKKQEGLAQAPQEFYLRVMMMDL